MQFKQRTWSGMFLAVVTLQIDICEAWVWTWGGCVISFSASGPCMAQRKSRLVHSRVTRQQNFVVALRNSEKSDHDDSDSLTKDSTPSLLRRLEELICWTPCVTVIGNK